MIRKPLIVLTALFGLCANPANLYAAVEGLAVSFSTNPIPLMSRPFLGCGWKYRMTVTETRGVHVHLEGARARWLDASGRVTAVSGAGCADWLNGQFVSPDLSPLGSTVPAFLGGVFEPQPFKQGTAREEWVVEGIDENGVHVVGKGTLELGPSNDASCPNDFDGDGIPDLTDNCPKDKNNDQKDADGDGLGDVCDPLNETDSDHDLLPDSWEIANWGSIGIVNDPNADFDNDGLQNVDEFVFGTSPKNPDTNGNGLNDGDELMECKDPAGCSSDTQCPVSGVCMISHCNLTTNTCEPETPISGCCTTSDGKQDSDCDGVSDDQDQCPNTDTTDRECADDRGCNCKQMICPIGLKAALLAKCQVGLPYVFGGKGFDIVTSLFLTPNDLFTQKYHLTTCTPGNCSATRHQSIAKGVDCSGLVYWSRSVAEKRSKITDKGSLFYEGTVGQFCNNTIPIDKLQPGDLLFFNFAGSPVSVCYPEHMCDPGTACVDHVMLYLGGPSGKNIVQAPNELEPVKFCDLNDVQKLTRADGGTSVKAFVGFRRVAPAEIAIQITALGSPITLEVEDPEGYVVDVNTVTATSREIIWGIPNVVYYKEADLDGDGELDEVVYSPVLKAGIYTITLVPKPDEDPMTPYTLEVETNGAKVTLADHVPLAFMPQEPYRFTSDGVTITPLASSTTTTTLAANGTTTTTLLVCETLLERACPCNSVKSHRKYLKCVKKAVKQNIVPENCRAASLACAKTSVCGRKNAIVCERTRKSGKMSCSAKPQKGACKPPKGGKAIVLPNLICCKSSF